MAYTVVQRSCFGSFSGTPESRLAVVPSPGSELDSKNPQYRLVIERQQGIFVYIMLDIVTGEVLRQTPCEEVLRLKSDSDASSGAVFDGRV